MCPIALLSLSLPLPARGPCVRGPDAPLFEQCRAARARRSRAIVSLTCCPPPLPAPLSFLLLTPRGRRPLTPHFFSPFSRSGLRSRRAPLPPFPRARPPLPAKAPWSAAPSADEFVWRVLCTAALAPHRILGHRRRCPPLGWVNRAHLGFYPI
jgi:hypothetical protein